MLSKAHVVSLQCIFMHTLNKDYFTLLLVKVVHVPEIRSCIVCGNQHKRLNSFKRRKAIDANYFQLLSKCFDVRFCQEDVCYMFICDKCASLCKSFCAFKDNGLISIKKFLERNQRQKRVSNTPPSTLKSRVNNEDSTRKKFKHKLDFTGDASTLQSSLQKVSK